MLRRGEVRLQRAQVGTCDLLLNSLQVLGVCFPALLVDDCIEGYSLSFVECRQTGLLDGADVNENVGTSAFRGDEPEAFLCMEELHRTDRHDQSP
jgi:hypothetical protein